MSSWLVVATLAFAQPADRLDCRLQPGAEWSAAPRDVTAVYCQGSAGFFVPSLEFRSLLDPTASEPYKLLSEELRLAVDETVQLRAALAESERTATMLKAEAAAFRESWMEAEKALEQAEEDGRRTWLESPLLWMAVGAAAASVVFAVALTFPP